MTHAAKRSQPGAHADERRAMRVALWCSYSHRFFGARHGEGELPTALRPVTCDDAIRTLHGVKDTVHPAVLRRCVGQMLVSGFTADHCRCEFEEVAVAAAAGECDPDRAVAWLRTWGEHAYGPRARVWRQGLPESPMRHGHPGIVLMPTTVTHDGDAFTVRTELLLQHELTRQVKALVNPKNWHKLGSYFATTKRVSGRDGPRGAWRGTLQEEFVVNWNFVRADTLDQLLEVDYTVTPSLARTDYALMYEEDNKVLINEGFLEVQTVPASPGWIRLSMEKTAKFTSTFLNLAAPAVLAMFLESHAGGFEAFLNLARDAGRRAAIPNRRAHHGT